MLLLTTLACLMLALLALANLWFLWWRWRRRRALPYTWQNALADWSPVAGSLPPALARLLALGAAACFACFLVNARHAWAWRDLSGGDGQRPWP